MDNAAPLSPLGQASQAPVLVVGEALVDVVVQADGTVEEHVGGSPANVAVGLARLGHRVELATCVGDDVRGARIIETVRASGVTIGDASVNAARTPTAVATLNAAGAATYEFDLHWDPAPIDDLPEGGHVHTGSIGAVFAPGAAVVRQIAEAARLVGTVSYDPNARPTLMRTPAEEAPTIEALIAVSDVVKASDEDVAWLYGAAPEEVIERWAPLGPSLVVVTMGGKGVLVGIAGEVHRAQADPTVVVRDTVGAGDSFMSGLISGLLDLGLLGGVEAREALAGATFDDVRPAVERALACADITVSRAGANPPTRDELAR